MQQFISRSLAPRLAAALLIAATAALFPGCAYYGFQEGAIPSNLNTIAIPLAQDNSINPVPSLERDLTGLLNERFVEQTRLRLSPNEADADALLSVTIQNYQNEPSTVGSDSRATLNRVTIRVNVRYVDQTGTTDEEMIARTFTAFGEYDPVQGGLDGERNAAEEALEKIVDDLFSAATSNW
jgi:hypothetical protein